MDLPKPPNPRISVAARVACTWLTAGLVYSIVFAAPIHPVMVLADVVAIGALVAIARRYWGSERWSLVTWIVVAAACIVAVAATQLLITDRNGVWLDEGEYLKTLHHGFIVRDGIVPFNLRWLEPVLAGPLNLFPVSGADALKACNFASLAVAASELVALLLALKVDRRVARLGPVILLCSYLGSYAATNRLVVDPFNYAAFVLICHALVADDDSVLRVILVIAACNSEKVIYWIPVIAVAKVLRSEHARAALWSAVRVCLPMVIYLGLVFAYTAGSTRDTSGTFVEQLHRLSLTWISPKVDDPVAIATMPQMLWFPFGAFTIFAVLALRVVDRWLGAIFLLLVPLVGQVLIAHDAERMVAYCFIVYIPLGSLYLTSALADVPKRLGWAVLVVFASLPVAQVYLLPLCRVMSDHGVHFVHPVLHVQRELKLALEALELLAVGALIWLHLTLFARR